ncbi:MAG: hypothetical protein WC421_02320 [Elusimicrobiales bacterium]
MKKPAIEVAGFFMTQAGRRYLGRGISLNVSVGLRDSAKNRFILPSQNYPFAQ